MSSPELCPFCRNTSVAIGRYSLGDVYGGPGFVPEDIQPSKWKKALSITPVVNTTEKAKACVHCGKVWAELDPDQLRELFRKYGTDQSKSRFQFDLG